MDIQLFEQLAKHDEELRARIYDDATGQTIGPGTHVIGNPTIAVGRNVGPSGPGLRADEMQLMLDNDAREYDAEAAQYPWYSRLNPVRQTVIALMVFNLGGRRFAGFHRLHAAGERQDYEAMATEMLDSNWAKPPPVGVGDRALRMVELMRHGVTGGQAT